MKNESKGATYILIRERNGPNIGAYPDKDFPLCPVPSVLKVFHLGPVVQSIVSLTSSLRVISLTVLVDSIYNILIFFAEKM